jgi:hypothetical protein
MILTHLGGLVASTIDDLQSLSLLALTQILNYFCPLAIFASLKFFQL